ncbi:MULTISPECIES: hypothetical protein [unclassified Streptomyces]|uniref:hypothetical protein n=1 Tax=unclassified Streptomyces TaxID=2593676 RepID=UPI002253977D|nr:MULTISPECIES: hypothetical protein [unclassified Streptomyces]MCX4987938.1 hypothetical protein [Streptomyces sp. NBC_00568]MCX5006930.1 hypothetical protein [Streptomyces sp. NBC_00638]
MREKPEVGGEEPGADVEPRKKRVDLSVPQVAGSAVAAVVAAKLASYFGVYGTILGAGLVSAIATCGGTLFQHFFRRTGEQIRDVKVQPKPKPRQMPGTPGEFTEGTVYRARVRSWKRPLVATALVFGVTMAGITTFEMVSGRSFSGDGTSTTVGDAFKGHSAGSGSPEPGTAPSTGSSPSTAPAAPEESSPSTGSGGSGDLGGGSGGDATADPTPGDGASPGPDAGGGAPTPAPSATATTPEPSASSHSQSAGPDRADPSAP